MSLSSDPSRVPSPNQRKLITQSSFSGIPLQRSNSTPKNVEGALETSMRHTLNPRRHDGRRNSFRPLPTPPLATDPKASQSPNLAGRQTTPTTRHNKPPAPLPPSASTKPQPSSHSPPVGARSPTTLSEQPQPPSKAENKPTLLDLNATARPESVVPPSRPSRNPDRRFSCTLASRSPTLRRPAPEVPPRVPSNPNSSTNSNATLQSTLRTSKETISPSLPPPSSSGSAQQNSTSSSNGTANQPAVPARPSNPPKIAPKPTLGSTPPSLPPKPAIFTEDEHIRLAEAFKKLCNANKQLLAVSKSILGCYEAEKGNNYSQFIKETLTPIRDELTNYNTEFFNQVREIPRNLDHKATCNVSNVAVNAAQKASVVCGMLRSAALEPTSNDSMFKQTLKSITTFRDSIVGLIELYKLSSEKLHPSLVGNLETIIQSTETSLSLLFGSKSSGQLISTSTKLEIEASARVAFLSLFKLVQSLNGPIEKSILQNAKVASCCISQMCAALIEVTNSTTLLSIPEIREQIAQFATDIKAQFLDFLEKMKVQVANPSSESYSVMKENIQPLREMLVKVVAQIVAFSDVDASSREKLAGTQITPSDQHLKIASATVIDPDIPLPPPGDIESTIDLPDNFVPDINPLWDEPEEDEGRVVYTKNGGLKCATLNKLIFYTTANLDMNCMKTFITTYRSFTTPETLLRKIIQRYHVPPEANVDPLPIQLRCCNHLKYLVETQSEDFSDNFAEMLRSFLTELEEFPAYKKYATLISTALSKKQEEQQTAKNEVLNLIIEEKIPLSPGKLLFVITEEEIARQLTLVDFQIYRAIKPVELLNLAWSKPKYRYRAKNVLALVNRSTALTRWVASVIIWQETLRGRVRAMTKIITIAHLLYKLHNFNSLMAVLAGLNTSSVYRLKVTREQLPEQTKQTLQFLQELMDPTGSYANCRQELRDIAPPVIPFLGIYLTDITFIEDGNPDYIDGLINYRKRELVYSVIREIQQYQQQSYTYEIVNIAHFLTELPNNEESALYDLSLVREPRGATLDQLV